MAERKVAVEISNCCRFFVAALREADTRTTGQGVQQSLLFIYNTSMFILCFHNYFHIQVFTTVLILLNTYTCFYIQV